MLSSYAQKRIFNCDYLKPGSYNISFIIDIPDINIELVKTTLNKIILKHNSLRTVFNYKGEPSILDENLDINLDYDFTTSNYVFKIINGTEPLIKAYIKNSKIYFIGHHIALDGWSINLFISEFLNYYSNKSDDITLSYTYQDYCKWEQTYMTSNKFQKSLIWWKSIVDNNFIQDLPYDNIDTSNTSFTYYSNRNNVLNIDILLSKFNLSFYNLFQIIIGFVIYFITDQTKIYLGGVSTNRPNIKSEKVIGMFVNTNIYVFDLNKLDTINDIIVQFKNRYYEVLSMSQVPYECYATKNVQIMVTSDNIKPDNNLESFLDTNDNISKFDLTFNSYYDSSLYFNITYDNKKFNNDTIITITSLFWDIVSSLTYETSFPVLQDFLNKFELKYQCIKSKYKYGEFLWGVRPIREIDCL